MKNTDDPLAEMLEAWHRDQRKIGFEAFREEWLSRATFENNRTLRRARLARLQARIRALNAEPSDR